MRSFILFIRGVAASALMAIMVVGAPLVLLRVGRIPAGVPDPLAPDNGAVLLAILTILGWLAWAVFTVSVILEFLALVSRQRLRVRLPGLAAPQGLAAALLLAIAAMLPLTAHAQPAPEREPHRVEDWLEHPSTPHAEPAKLDGFRYTVQRGDDLWTIAERFYGDGFAWKRIAEANPIITVPHEIDHGWELILPGIDPPAPSTPESVEEAPEAAAEDPVPPAPEAAGTPSSAPSVPVSEETSTDASTVDVAAYLTAGISSLTAAALLGVLAMRRATQLATRPAGRRITHPPASAQHLETALGRTQDPLSLRALDLALRALGQHYRDNEQPLPALGTVLVEKDTIILEVDRIPDRVPEDFHADHRRLWVGRVEARALESRAEALRDEPSPYPALVCLGETPEGALLLVDLESLGVIGLEGSPSAVQGLLGSLILELSSSWWGHGQSVTVIDGDDELVDVLDDPTVTVAKDLAGVLADLEQEATHRAPARAEEHPRDVRCEADFTEAWRPHIVLIGRSLTNQERSRAGALVADGHAVIVAVDSALETLQILPSPALSRVAGGQTFRAQALTRRSRDELVALLRATNAVETTEASWWAEPSRSAGLVRPASTSADWHSDGATVLSLAARKGASPEKEPAVDSHEPVLHPTVLLFGPVELVGTRGDTPQRAARQCAEYAAWLLENPRATASMMSNALMVAESTRRSNMSRLRSWLGCDDEGERYLPEAYSGRISLHPEVTSDWNHIQLLTIGGVNRTPDANLTKVLELVRGAPVADAAPGQWHWAEELRCDMASLVRDVGLVLTERALDRNEIDTARWAINRALIAAPEDERLLAARVRAEYRAGNTSEVERLALRLVRSARKLNVDLADETVTLLQEVMEGGPRARGLG